MLSRIDGVTRFEAYKSTFIPASDALLWPYEARSVERLTRRTIAAEAPLGHLQIAAAAKAARRDYLAEAVPRWVKAAAVRVVRAPRALGEALAGLGRWLEIQDQNRRERFLAQSGDLHELERRIRAIERHAVQGLY